MRLESGEEKFAFELLKITRMLLRTESMLKEKMREGEGNERGRKQYF